MQSSNKCIKCGSLAIGHLARRFDLTVERSQAPPPLMLGVIGSTRQGAGILETYVCTECGYAETYVQNPSTVAFETLRGFRWVNEPNAQRGTFR